MIFEPTEVAGCYVVVPELREDERGCFARTFCAEEFAARGLDPCVAQCSISQNARLGTLRGLHHQAEPHAEAKLVRCTRGRVFDVAVDLRPSSPSYRHWTATELSGRNRLALYVPKGCAHGFLTLEPDCEISYQISEPHRGEAARGIRWDDPAIAIDWPDVPSLTISDRDRTLPTLATADFRRRRKRYTATTHVAP